MTGYDGLVTAFFSGKQPVMTGMTAFAFPFYICRQLKRNIYTYKKYSKKSRHHCHNLEKL